MCIRDRRKTDGIPNRNDDQSNINEPAKLGPAGGLRLRTRRTPQNPSSPNAPTTRDGFNRRSGGPKGVQP
eukprot:5052991-Alexandrium_andersonii.AAC.1